MPSRDASPARFEQHPTGALRHVRLSLVIPAWNERETIEQAIHEASAALCATVADHEIIIVDDGSTDGTAEIVRAMVATNPRVRMVQHPRNRGYGAALRSGFQAAHGDLVAFTDADCQFDLSELEYLLPLVKRYDIVCGYRIDRQDPMRRRLYSWGYNTLVSLLLGSPVHDIDCAFKIFHRTQLLAILPECDNFFANAEMLSKAQAQGLSVVEVGVHHRPRAAGRSKVSLLEIPKTLVVLLPFWWCQVLFAGSNQVPMSRRTGFWAALALVLVLVSALLLPNLSYPLLEPDEGRYAEIAREMLASGNWLVPTLNYRPYYDKPPLLYWLIGGSFKLFGVSAWAARLVPVVAGLLTVLATFIVGARVVGLRAALLAALTLTLSIGFVLCGRMVTLDSLLSLFVAFSLLAAYRAIAGARFSWSWWLASSIACALGVLTKGPVALVLLVPPLELHIWLTANRVRPTLAHWAVYAGVVSCLVMPWYAMIIAQAPEFAHHFFWKHHIHRFLLGAYHPRPIWYFIPVLALGSLPWSWLLFDFARFLFHRSPAARSLRPQSLGFFFLWAGWCLLFFSLSSGKLPVYILPAAPAIALVFGLYLDRVLFPTSERGSLERAHGVGLRRAAAIVSGAAIVIGAGAWLLDLEKLPELLIESTLWVAALVGVVLLRNKCPPKAAWIVCSVVSFSVISELAHELWPAWAYRYSPVYHSREITELITDSQTGVACYGREWGSVAFYSGRDDVFNFSNLPTKQLSDFLKRYPRSLLVIKSTAEPDWFQRAVPQGMEMTELSRGRDATYLLVQRGSAAEAIPAVSAQRDEVRR